MIGTDILPRLKTLRLGGLTYLNHIALFGIEYFFRNS